MIPAWFPTWEILTMAVAAVTGAWLFGARSPGPPAIDVDDLVRAKELERWNRTR